MMVINYHHTFSQFRDINWVFGDSTGLNFSLSSPLYLNSSIFTQEPCASISDESENLQFYTNGAKDWTKEHEIMTLGNHLFIGGVGWPLSTITQGVIIIPDPGDTNQYYIFQNDNPFYYSKVDMSLSDGFGSVYIHNEILYDIPAMEKMTAVKHGNGRDGWLIIPAYPEGGSDGYGNPLLYYEFLITPDGIEGPFIKEGVIYENQNAVISIGQMKFNRPGDFLGVTNGKSVILYKFDRCAGDLYNPEIIVSVFSGSNGDFLYGLDFSPDGTKMYVSKA
ncbi:MAG: hypothetical protein ACK4IY_01560, partial [Chitinophagales bacterium]